MTNVADVLNAMDKTVSRELLTNLETRNPELTMSIRKKMFTFEDLLLLGGNSIQHGGNSSVEITSALAMLVWGPLVGGLLFYFLKKIRREPATVETAFTSNPGVGAIGGQVFVNAGAVLAPGAGAGTGALEAGAP